MATLIQHVLGNPLSLAVPLTQVVRQLVNGEETDTRSDFYPSPDYPVEISFTSPVYSKKYAAVMHGNVATITDEACMMTSGMYNMTITCKDMDGKPRRFAMRDAVKIVSYTADSGIEAGIEFDATTYTLDGAVFFYAKGDKGDPFTYEDFTQEQIAELQRPANEAASRADEATASANAAAQEASSAAQDARIATEGVENAIRNAESATASANTAAQSANNAANSANDAAALANTKAGVANDAAIRANEKAALADSAASNANEKAGLANDAASNANAKAGVATEAAVVADAAAQQANNVNATLNSSTITITDRNGQSRSLDVMASLEPTWQALTQLVSDFAEGKTDIADAIEAWGVQASDTEPFSSLKAKIEALPVRAQGEEGIVPHIYHGAEDYDMLNEMHNHQRVDYPYLCSVLLDGSIYQEVDLQGADAYLTSDGTFVVGGGDYSVVDAHHVFTDSKPNMQRYIIYYFAEPIYLVPVYFQYIIGLYCYNGKPKFTITSNTVFQRGIFSYVGEPYELNAGDININTNHNLKYCYLAGLTHFKAGDVLMMANSIGVNRWLPDLKVLGQTLVLPNSFNPAKVITFSSLEEVAITSSSACPYNGTAVEKLHFPELTTVHGGCLTVGSMPNLRIVNVPKLRVVQNTLSGIYGLFQSPTTLMTELNLPSLHTCTEYLWSALYSSLRTINLGAPQDGTIYVRQWSGVNNYVTSVTVQQGFRSNLYMDTLSALSRQVVLDIFNNLADNTDYPTLTISLHADVKALLSDADKLIATNKNYTIA